MNNATVVKIQVLVLCMMLASCTPSILAQRSKSNPAQPQTAPAPTPAQAQAAPAAPPSVCGTQAVCYETNDFAATITQFRTSTDGYGNKILDAIMHFQNKTNQVLSLGYVDGSASGLDDRGNRYGLNTYGGGVRGIGVVAGNNVDPKFALQPGGTGDVRVEWYWSPRGAIAGVNYEVELSIREINQVEGNQWALGNETLLHYQGLANGMGVASASSFGSVGTSGGAATSSGGMAIVSPASTTATSVGSAFAPSQPNAVASASQPCAPAAGSNKIAGVANAAGQQNASANSAVTNATQAITSITSIFGHKKAAAAPANTATAVPCPAPTNATVSTGSTPAPVANTVTPPATTAPAPAVASRAVAKPAATTQTTVVKASLKQPVPPTAPTKTPATAVPAAKKPSPVPATKKPASTPAKVPAGSSGGSQ